jgi:DNA invertase Pin-like site-specific DNA recombinase
MAIAAIALLAMFAQMERIYMLARAADGRAAREARGLPTGRPAKLNATTRAGAAQRTNGGAMPEQVVAARRQPLAAPRCTESYTSTANTLRRLLPMTDSGRSRPYARAEYTAALPCCSCGPGGAK